MADDLTLDDSLTILDSIGWVRVGTVQRRAGLRMVMHRHGNERDDRLPPDQEITEGELLYWAAEVRATQQHKAAQLVQRSLDL